MHHSAILFLSYFVLAIGVAGASDPRPNILLIVSDDQRPDTISALGNPHIETPTLDWLVEHGTTFTHAVCANPICTPSRAELLTGCSGFRNGVLDFGGMIDPELATLPEPFADAGYATWYSGKWHNNGRPPDHGYGATSGLFTGGGGRWSVDQTDYRGQPVTGFRGWIFRDAAGDPLPELGVGLTPEISETIADAAIEVIGNSGERPWFLHVNFTAPHDPLLLPPGFESRYAPQQIPVPENFLPEHPFDHGNLRGRDEELLPWPRTGTIVQDDLAAYYAVISHMDQQIGRVLDALRAQGVLEQTIIVFTSDHGLAVGSHGLRGKQNMYEHTVGVPLIFVGPGEPAGVRRDAPCYLRDLFPTLCELAGLSIPETIEGRSQVPVLQGLVSATRRFVVGYFRDSQRMIRKDGWKLIRYPQAGREQLFHTEDDPHEIVDLAGEPRHQRRRQALSGELDRWLAAHGDTPQTP